MKNKSKNKNKNKNSKVVIALAATLIVMAFQAIDIIYIHQDGSLFGGNVIARIAGIGVAIIAAVILRFNIKNFCFKTFNWFVEILYGFVFAVIPFAVCLGAEYVALTLKGYDNLHLNIWFPNTNTDMSIKGTILAMGLFTATVLLEAVFKELFFRGFLITQFFDKFGIKKANFIQAFFFMLMIVPETLDQISAGAYRKENLMTTLFVIGCSLTLEFMSGIKWGLYYRVNGTLWMSVSDHFFNHMLLQCLYITYSVLPPKWAILEAFGVQVVSFCMFIPLYFKRDKLNEEIALEVAVRRELAGLPVDNYSPSPLRRFIENKNFERQEEYARKRNLPTPKKEKKSYADFEEAVSLEESTLYVSGRVSEEKLEELEKITGESAEEIISEIEQSEPSSVIEEAVNETALPEENVSAESEDKSTEDSAVGADNISKLVHDYFEENFNKHTF